MTRIRSAAAMPSPLPGPLTPADCDLRGLSFMPLDVGRLVDSDMVALTTGEEFKAAVILWCKCWQQVPAASLPDDDRVLAHLTGAGARWSRVKTRALHGFVRCSDGRWYHPVVAEKARDAWQHRLRQRAKANKRWGNGAADVATTAAKPAPKTKRKAAASAIAPPCDRPVDTPAMCDPVGLMRTYCDLAGMPHPTGVEQETAQVAIVQGWIDAGLDPDRDIRPTIESMIMPSADPTRSLRRFDASLRHRVAQRAAAESRQAAMPAATITPPVFLRADEPGPAAEFRRALAAAIGEAPYRAWFEDCRIRYEGDTLRLVFASRFRAEQAPRNHSDVVERLAARSFAARMVCFDAHG